MAEQSIHLTEAFSLIAADIKALETAIGNLATLTTTDKASLPGAINELVSRINTIQLAAGEILDTAGVGDAAHTWSADKIITQLNELKNDILGGASTLWDTLQEVEVWAADKETLLSQLIGKIANRVAFDAPQTLTDDQKKQACANIGALDPTINWAEVYATAKAAV